MGRGLKGMLPIKPGYVVETAAVRDVMPDVGLWSEALIEDDMRDFRVGS